VSDWQIGIDNSDSDAFKIHFGTGFAVNDYITVSTAGLATIGATGGTQIHRINGDTGTAGAVVTYLKLNVSGTEYRVPLHATA
jgi:hypothetical protein